MFVAKTSAAARAKAIKSLKDRGFTYDRKSKTWFNCEGGPLGLNGKQFEVNQREGSAFAFVRFVK